MLTHQYGFGAFLLAVILVAPVLTVFFEFILTAILHPVIEDTRFDGSNRFMGISIVASLGAAFFIFKGFNKLVVYEGDQPLD
jgi:hypothetical protein